MGIFQQFPYSNFHEMNLDQIIKIMREMQDEWENTKTEWASYKDYIDNYFANLDLDEETEKALRRLIADGTLDPVIDPVIAAETAAWLDDHITQPTTPAIDTSLTVAGAAADAKAAGDAINDIKADLIAAGAEIQAITWGIGYYTDQHAINPTATTWRCGELTVSNDYRYYFAGGNTSANHPLIFMAKADDANIKSIDGGDVYPMQELIIPTNTVKLYISYEETTPVTVLKVGKYIADDAIKVINQKNGVIGAFYDREYSYNAPNRTVNSVTHGFDENVLTFDHYGNAEVYALYKTVFTYKFICNPDIINNGINISFRLISSNYSNPQNCNIRIYNATDSSWVYASPDKYTVGLGSDITVNEYVPSKHFSGLNGKQLVIYFRSDAANPDVTAGHLTIEKFMLELYRGAVTYKNIDEYVSDVIQPDFIPPTAAASVVAQSTPSFTTLTGKTWNAVGDSVTASGTYITGVSSRLGLTGVNVGVSACTMAINNTYLVNKSIVERVLGINGNTSPADADIWTIMGGYNDQLYGTPIGDITSTDMSTYYGALKAVCEYIRKRPNNPKLIIMTPAQSYRDGEYMHDIVKACHDVAKLYAAPVIDIFNESGICPANFRDVTSDLLHPNNIGYGMLISTISAGIEKNC